jgi:hypothetical protein
MPRSTDWTWKNSVCADPKKDLFVPIPIFRVLKHVLQFVHFSNKTSYNPSVKSFYAASGIDFGEKTTDIFENAVLRVNSACPIRLLFTPPHSTLKKIPCVVSSSQHRHHIRDPLRSFQTLAIQRWLPESPGGTTIRFFSKKLVY